MRSDRWRLPLTLADQPGIHAAILRSHSPSASNRRQWRLNRWRDHWQPARWLIVPGGSGSAGIRSTGSNPFPPHSHVRGTARELARGPASGAARPSRAIASQCPAGQCMIWLSGLDDGPTRATVPSKSVKRVFFIGISSFILPRKFDFRITLRSGGLPHRELKRNLLRRPWIWGRRTPPKL